MQRDAIYIVIILVLLAVVLNIGRREDRTFEETITETIRTDSATFYKPDPVTLDYRTVKVQVPRWLLGNVSEVPTGSADDREDNFTITDGDTLHRAELALRIETRHYRDSTFEAQVSGPAFAEYRPTLDWVKTYETTRDIIRTVPQVPAKWWEVRATAGAFYTPSHSDLWAGVSAQRFIGRWNYGASVGYGLSGEPFFEVRGGVRLFDSNR